MLFPEPAAPVVSVRLFRAVGRELAYRVPPALASGCVPGAMVRVPLRRQHELGVVWRAGSDDPLPPERLKWVGEVLHPFPALDAGLMRLAEWISGYYACPLETILESFIPSPVRRERAAKVQRLLAIARPLEPLALEHLRRRAPKQAAVYEFLCQQMGPVERGLLLQRLKTGPVAVHALLRKEILRQEERVQERVAYADAWGDTEAAAAHPPELTQEQAVAVGDIHRALAEGTFAVQVLQGITGSGKTEVYLRAIETVVNAGGGVVYLVPEVMLTPQTVGRLRARIDAAGVHRTVVWHSQLGEGERIDAWRALATGRARVVVGARSAVFTPVQNLRLVVVDEEHEPAYKQEEAPRYHGRDVAVYRARLAGAVCVLGSATPSLETLQNIRWGKYRLSRLTRRIDDRRLPTVHLVDLRREVLARRGPVLLSRLLADKLRDRFEKREQSILFLNRRGHSRTFLCPDCGFVARCEHCSIALTYHRTDERLKCHLCGAESSVPTACPQCRSAKVRRVGAGTQKVEDALRHILPTARIVRLDADVMQLKNRFRQILADFRAGKIDVLVGTQMIAKGLDFPNVTLVGLVDADLGLHVPDFRAGERTFHLLVQVAGRAGRGDKAGEVVVQTYTPASPSIQFGRRADVDGFSEAELEARRQLNYPPFRHLVRHILSGRNDEKVAFFAEQWARAATAGLGDRVEIRGPAPAPLEKVKDVYRYQIWFFVSKVTGVIQDLAELERAQEWPEDVTRAIDVDPVDLC